jgi:hypothetical protein
MKLPLLGLVNATQRVGPALWPECERRHDKDQKNQPHGRLHEAKLWGVLCHKPTRHESCDDQKPSDDPTEHSPVSYDSTKRVEIYAFLFGGDYWSRSESQAVFHPYPDARLLPVHP